MELLDKIQEQQRTIDMLLDTGEIKFLGETNGDKWKLEPIYQKEDCSVGFVHATESTGKFPDHVHVKSKEYLIVVSGSVIFNLNDKDIRVLNEGECAAVPVGVKHHSKPLTNNTKLLYICIPSDINIPNSKE